MHWQITESGGVVTLGMRSNKVNKLNDEFFADLHAALDLVEREHPRSALVLTGSGNVFSAGVDFEYTFPIFARKDAGEIAAWFHRFSGALLRLLNYPYPTVAAVNGHAIAGGLLVALCCDVRIGVCGDARAGLNEVLVGIPMPSLFTELVRLRCGSPATIDAILTGTLYGHEDARRLGFYNELVSADELGARAHAHARVLSTACLDTYAHCKKMLHAPAMVWIEQHSNRLDAETIQVIASDAACQAQAGALAQLKRQRR